MLDSFVENTIQAKQQATPTQYCIKGAVWDRKNVAVETVDTAVLREEGELI